MSWVIMGAAVFLYIFFFTSDKEITDIKRWFWLVFINRLFFNDRGYFSVSWPTGNQCRLIGALSAVNYRLSALCFIDGNQNTRRKPFNCITSLTRKPEYQEKTIQPSHTPCINEAYWCI